ncbi:recombination regulator RecX [Nonomuraea sp. NPDC050310]|uniref:recombination regulator RecX n=1 Tax=Nonomuraea sp. NPDC050310 TaxID=3154935 RepID=UPI0033E56FF8
MTSSSPPAADEGSWWAPAAQEGLDSGQDGHPFFSLGSGDDGSGPLSGLASGDDGSETRSRKRARRSKSTGYGKRPRRADPDTDDQAFEPAPFEQAPFGGLFSKPSSDSEPTELRHFEGSGLFSESTTSGAEPTPASHVEGGGLFSELTPEPEPTPVSHDWGSGLFSEPVSEAEPTSVSHDGGGGLFGEPTPEAGPTSSAELTSSAEPAWAAELSSLTEPTPAAKPTPATELTPPSPDTGGGLFGSESGQGGGLFDGVQADSGGRGSSGGGGLFEGEPFGAAGGSGGGLFDDDGGERRRAGRGKGRYGRKKGRGRYGDGPDPGSGAAQGPPADPESVARNIALRLLAMAPKTRAQLAEAMRKREVPEEVANVVLDRFTELGWINDEAFAEAWVESRHHGRGLAKRALAAELRHRGVDGETVNEAVERLDPDQELETARRLVERKLGSTRGLESQVRIRRLAGMLARKGYAPGLAYRVVREALEQEGIEVEDDFS